MMHSDDAKERPQLYKMNFLGTEQIIKNSTILLRVSGESGDPLQDVPIPPEEEIISIITDSR